MIQGLLSEVDEGDEGQSDRGDEGPDTVLWRNCSHVSAASPVSPACRGWLEMGKDGDTLPELESALFQTFFPFDNAQHFSEVALNYSFAIVTHSLQKYFNGTFD